MTLSADGTILYCNRRLADMLHMPHERVIGHTLQHFLWPVDAVAFQSLLGEARHCGVRREMTLRTTDEVDVPVNISLNVLNANDRVLLCGVLTDLTAQKVHLLQLAEANARLSAEIAEREKAQDALRQAQKMEAIGHLTGGIAHDFNNMLQGIMSGITLAQRRIESGRADEVPGLLDASMISAERAATLTRCLLGFGQRQPHR